ncbi:catalase-like [Pararge aegeria]|uniref:catalase-like n=1 Tax=Pararge aegeria TaxID=116150 RepID=UPI0019D14944|nr:catalase-like [Pararge aegeria]
MLALLIIFAVSVMAMQEDQWDPVKNHMLEFKENTDGPIGMLTSSGGAPIPYCEATNSLNNRLINNEFFMDAITHVNRERIPERVVHAKGTGAFGYFEVTHDISNICKADFLNDVGKKTPIAVRFSTTQGSRGSSDLNREVKGFSIKFYTEEGNLDLIGFNTPMYTFKDPIRFPNFVHATGRNPGTFLFDRSTFWDVITLNPESMFLFLRVFSDYGIPASYVNMPGFPIHTFQVVNKNREIHFVRFHILPDAGIKNLMSAEARNISSFDPDYVSRNLYQQIGKGEFPSWTVSVQILSKADVKRMGYKAFEVSRVIPTKDFPLHPIGKIVLDKNFNNFHAQIEQLAFCPSNLVPGILGGPDIMYESRRFAYRDAQSYRLGGNFKKIPVNCPFQTNTYTINRDGVGPVGSNEEDVPSYYPNSFNGPEPNSESHCSSLIKIYEEKAYNFDQAAEFYANELTSDEKTRLIENLVFELQPAVKMIQEKTIKLLTTIHPDLGNRVAKQMNLS